MGWLWASSSPAKPSASAQDRSVPDPDPAQRAAPNEPVDPEMQKFFDLFRHDKANTDAPHRESPPTSSPQQDSPSSSSTSPSSLSSWLSLKTSPKTPAAVPSAPLGDALSESLLPTEMSCRQAFDLAWSCNSVGGQFNSVYRYGSMGSCSELWNDFWFCMRIKSYTGELKESTIRAHYRNKEHAKYGPGKPSSQDVWESREQKMLPGTAFTESVDETLNHDEWRRTETERRRQIRQGLGFDDDSSP